MREFTLRALPVCFVAVVGGCLSTNGPGGTTGGPTTTPTHAYWRQVNAVLARKPSGDDMKALVKLVQEQTDALRALSPEGVDTELVSATEEVVRCEEEVLRVAALSDYDTANLKKNQTLAVAYSEANRKAVEAKKRLKGLRGPLNARLGGGFEAPTG
jgi:hypothetical protein